MLKSSLVLMLLITSGCSRLDFAMKWADTFVMSAVTDYFELTSEQDDAAREDFKAALKDIQKLDFPVFVAELNAFASAVEKKEMTDAKLDKFLDQVDKALKNSMVRFEPMAQDIIKDQVKSDFKMFDKEFLKKNEKDMKTAKDPDEQLKKARKNVDRFVDETIGELREDQEKEIEAEMKANPFPAVLQMESRKAMFEKFKTVRKDEAQRKDFVNKYFTNWDSLQTPEYKKARDQAFGRFRAWIKKLLGNLDDRQRAHLVKVFRGRAEELKKISEK